MQAAAHRAAGGRSAWDSGMPPPAAMASMGGRDEFDLLPEERVRYFFDGGAWRLLNFQIRDDAAAPYTEGAAVSAGAALLDASEITAVAANETTPTGFAAQMARAAADFDRDAEQLSAALRDRGRASR